MNSFHDYFRKNQSYLISTIVLLFVLRIIEFFFVEFIGESQPAYSMLFIGFLLDVLLGFVLLWSVFPIQLLFSVCRIKRNLVFPTAAFLFILLSAALIYFFKQAKIPLDETIYFFTWKEIKTIMGEINEYFPQLITGFLLLLLLFWGIQFLSKKRISSNLLPKKIATFSWLTLLLTPFVYCSSKNVVTEVYTNNRLVFFIGRTYNHFNKSQTANHNETKIEPNDFAALDPNFFSEKPKNPIYPLMHAVGTDTVFASKFNSENKKTPNIVFIIVEGLSGDFVGKFASTTGNVMPFLDSLKSKSLYFPNFLSTCQRTYNVLPASLASVPNSNSGMFTQLNSYTPQVSLQMLLNKNYFSRFYCGVDLSFSNMHGYMSNLKTQYLVKNWAKKYKTSFSERENYWGYPDDRVYRKSWEDYSNQHLQSKPRFDVFLTISSHEPFVFPNEKQYVSKVEKLLKKQKLHESVKNNKLLLASFMYTDDALKLYFEKAKQQPDFENTIFFIYGDHGTPHYSRTGLSKFHIPLVVYSPLLKKPEVNKALNTQLDIAPSLLSLLKHNYKMTFPKELPFVGKPFEFSSKFRANRSIPFLSMGGKNEFILHKNVAYLHGELYQLKPDLKLKRIHNAALSKKLEKQLRLYDLLSKYCFNKNRIVPPVFYTQLSESQPHVDNRFTGDYKLLKEISEKKKTKSTEEFIGLGKTFALAPNVKRVRIVCEIDHYMTDKDESRHLPRLVANLVNSTSKKQVIWQISDPAILKKQFKKNSYNTMVYVVDINIPVEQKIEKKNEFFYYIYNPNHAQMDFKKCRVRFYTSE